MWRSMVVFSVDFKVCLLLTSNITAEAELVFISCCVDHDGITGWTLTTGKLQHWVRHPELF